MTNSKLITNSFDTMMDTTPGGDIARAYYNITGTCIKCGEDDKDMSCEKINK